jgi:hypothetical protein
MAPGECIEVNIVADPRVRLAQGDSCTDLLGKYSFDRIAEQHYGCSTRPLRRKRNALGRWRDWIAEVDVQLQFDRGGRDTSRHRDTHSRVQIGLSDRLRGNRVDQELDPVFLVHDCLSDLTNTGEDGSIVVGLPTCEEVDIRGRTPGIEDSQQHSTFEHKHVGMR